MSALSKLIDKARERLNLGCYTPWEIEFLTSVIDQYDRRGGLSEKQADKLRQIVRERWIQGKKPPTIIT